MVQPSHDFFFQAEDGIRDRDVTGVQTCALPISCILSHNIALNGQDGGLGLETSAGIDGPTSCTVTANTTKGNGSAGLFLVNPVDDVIEANVFEANGTRGSACTCTGATQTTDCGTGGFCNASLLCSQGDATKINCAGNNANCPSGTCQTVTASAGVYLSGEAAHKGRRNLLAQNSYIDHQVTPTQKNGIQFSNANLDANRIDGGLFDGNTTASISLGSATNTTFNGVTYAATGTACTAAKASMAFFDSDLTGTSQPVKCICNATTPAYVREDTGVGVASTTSC